MSGLKIAIGADHGGFELKNELVQFISSNGYEFKDFGIYEKISVDYPIISKTIAKAVANGEYDRGIIICGSGLGVAIAANKIRGIRAVTCHDTYSARMSRAHNNANVLTMGERVIGKGLAVDVLNVWLKSEFEKGRHEKRVSMIEDL
ncbi:MAG: ribose 5-phosphate isomerase B [Candidatus Gastranaerophilaceae bacterium]